MGDSTVELIQQYRDEQYLAGFAGRLLAWLVADLNRPPAGATAPAFTASRTRALLRATDLWDEPTWLDFSRLMDTPAGTRLALADLLNSSGLAENDEVIGLSGVAARTAPEQPAAIDWLPLVVSAFAWKRQYPLYQLDPASPPGEHSPAGQILRQAVHFVRQQVQRSATEREKLARTLRYNPGRATTLDAMPGDAPIPPLPPHFRPPIPVRYPEYNRETIQVDANEVTPPPNVPAPPPAPAPGERIVITEEDLPTPAGASTTPVTMPAISISRDQVEPARPPSPLPASGVVMPTPSRSSGSSSMTLSLRNMFRSEELKSTKLRVVVQQYPDGPGLYGLQVKVTCRGIRSFVAGTTDRAGNFLAELPVRLSEGLTYDVDVTWPREEGGETERKSITLNADRTEFKLPFHRQLNPG